MIANSNTKIRAAVYADLLRKYPVLQKKMPLAIGAHEQILAVVLDRSLVAYVLGKQTRNSAYLKALSAGGKRFNLDGSDAGEISEIHQVFARERIAECEEKTVAKKAAKKPLKALPEVKKTEIVEVPLVVQKTAVTVTIKKRKKIV